ncbi:MAG: hypothetical protein BWY67_02441 [Bacteroidetes bacterium ADurb.Bin397]|nr:MAG: hypothetical protein BWY67_02441 [Bacteroidetes bacterium ADurb.Bin397]
MYLGYPATLASYEYDFSLFTLSRAPSIGEILVFSRMSETVKNPPGNTAPTSPLNNPAQPSNVDSVP